TPPTVSWHLERADDDGGDQDRPTDQGQPLPLDAFAVDGGYGGAGTEPEQVGGMQPRPARDRLPALGGPPGRPPHPPGAGFEAAEQDETAHGRGDERDQHATREGQPAGGEDAEETGTHEYEGNLRELAGGHRLVGRDVVGAVEEHHG